MLTVIGIVCLIAAFLIVMSIFKRSKKGSNDTLPTQVYSEAESHIEARPATPATDPTAPVPTTTTVKKQNRPLNKRKR